MSSPSSPSSKQRRISLNRKLLTESQGDAKPQRAASVPTSSPQQGDDGAAGDPLLLKTSSHRHAHYKSAPRKRKRRGSTILILFLFLLIVLFAMQVVYVHRDWLHPVASMPEMLLENHPQWKLDSSLSGNKTNGSAGERNQQSTSTHRSANANAATLHDNPLLRLLFKAGVEIETDLTAAERAQLPAVWHNMQEMYGNLSEPIVWGLHTCQAYRDKVPNIRDRYTAVAGLFNTGTNAMEFHLQHNLRMPSKWQVPWGKHRVPAVCLNHTAPGFEKVNRERVMPIIMIRDPFAFMQSMCKCM